MPVSKEEFDDLRALSFRDPDEVLDDDKLYTIYEIARMLQGLDPDADIDTGTEAILLDWAIPWVLTNSDEFVFAEPRADDEPGYYGIES
ncbi:DUF5827 family protein [Salinibaculum salinum]|uniref:DUF5827 family protein n=1 Tax=Salinibaculum salinum TaxID=3131996 RepID=UPI0030EF5D28